ncbi:hypothetical protein [Aquisalimonas asiatica]|uniref:Uncharacterized protein n=1 Tax=Aquisalimonas asiatica TaxID=406100 RepID=A0A1H8Q174_9GAMM|nr:hypothetical protein [Aquisalimonas asiatica]SEO47950.1 hypothetical protein SAMN04488052_101285 [Aquisalimonas asiatica]
MLRATLAAVFAALFSGTVMAHGCPGLVAEIDEVLKGDDVDSHIEADVLERAQALRDEGEQYHEDGDHDRAMEKLEEAKRELGI